MDDSLKQRLLGAIVIIGLAIIFLPAILDKEEDTRLAVTMQIPERPEIVKDIDIDKALDKQQAEFDQQTIEKPEALIIEPDEIIQKKPSEIAQDAKDGVGTPLIEEATEELVNKPAEVVKQAEEKAVEKTVTKKPVESKAKEQWVVQLGSFSKQENAEKLKEKLSKSYSKLYIENVTIPGGSTYRLRLGNFNDKDAAIQQRRQIKTKYGIAGVVMAKE